MSSLIEKKQYTYFHFYKIIGTINIDELQQLPKNNAA